MTINADIKYYYSGGAAGTAVNSLGGVISVNEVQSSTDENLFRNITDPVTTETQHYCLYLKNEGAVSYDISMYISTPTPSLETSVYLSNGTSGVNGTEQTIGDNSIEPTGMLWTQRYFDFNPLVIATLAPNETQAVWFRLIQLANAGGKAMDYCRITLV